MSLDYNLRNCNYKTNGELIDAISDEIGVDEDRAGELIFNICMAIAVSEWKLETESDIEIIMDRLKEKGSATIVSKNLLRLAIGIQTNVIPK